MMLARATSQLLVVDIQARLLPAMSDGERTLAQAQMLAEAARKLGVPITISEQYPKGLGPTVAGVLDAAGPDAAVLQKMTFSALATPALAAHLEASGRRQIVLCGIEAHVCVLQSALDLLARGYRVALATDAIASRVASSKDVAIARLVQAGVVPVTCEMAIFEWLGAAGTDDFKAILPLIK